MFKPEEFTTIKLRPETRDKLEFLKKTLGFKSYDQLLNYISIVLHEPRALKEIALIKKLIENIKELLEDENWTKTWIFDYARKVQFKRNEYEGYSQIFIEFFFQKTCEKDITGFQIKAHLSVFPNPTIYFFIDENKIIYEDITRKLKLTFITDLSQVRKSYIKLLDIYKEKLAEELEKIKGGASNG